MNSKWFKGFKGTQEQRESLERSIRSSNYILNILTEVIEEDIKALEATKGDDYNNPNWALMTADKQGQIRALRRILQLTKLEDQ